MHSVSPQPSPESPQIVQGASPANRLTSSDSLATPILKTAIETPDFWVSFLDELRERFNLVFDQWESDFRERR